MKEEIQLQVLICTMGEAGIRRVAESRHPQVAGVEYLVSWQLPDGDCPIPEALLRPDFCIVKNPTRGLSHNRNLAISAASAPLCLISDDDIDYTPEALRLVINTFHNNPDLDIATFKYSGADTKYYPDFSFDLRKPAKGYYVSSIEMGFRLESVRKSGVEFNQRFGIGAEFPAGEEDIWIYDLLQSGLKGRFFPSVIARHAEETTGTRRALDPAIIRTKGAVFRHTHPRSWPLRMLAHALRHARRHGITSFFPYCHNWLKGSTDFSN